MRFQKFERGAGTVVSLAALTFLAALAGGACEFFKDDITSVVVNQNQGQGNGTPTASPSPGTPTGAITQVRVSTFGEETCPGGGSPATEPNSVRVACVQPLTCSPLLADGSQAPPILHGPAPDSFEVASGSSSGTLLAAPNPFNADLRGDSPGTARVRCSVGGIVGTLDVSVLP